MLISRVSNPIIKVFLISLFKYIYKIKLLEYKKKSIHQFKNFNVRFLIINVVAFFPILLALALSVNIYDNLRLTPFSHQIGSLSGPAGNNLPLPNILSSSITTIS